MNEKEENNEIPEHILDLAAMTVGEFVPIANGYEYTFIVTDKPPVKNQKEWQGKPAGFKWAWECIILEKTIVVDELDDKVLTRDNVDKAKAIMALEPGKVYVLELPKGGTQNLADFIKNNGFIRMAMHRTGAGSQTIYHFAGKPVEMPKDAGKKSSKKSTKK